MEQIPKYPKVKVLWIISDINPKQSDYRACFHIYHAALPPKTLLTIGFIHIYIHHENTCSCYTIFLDEGVLLLKSDSRHLVYNPNAASFHAAKIRHINIKDPQVLVLAPTHWSRTSGPPVKVLVSSSRKSQGASVLFTHHTVSYTHHLVPPKLSADFC